MTQADHVHGRPRDKGVAVCMLLKDGLIQRFHSIRDLALPAAARTSHVDEVTVDGLVLGATIEVGKGEL